MNAGDIVRRLIRQLETETGPSVRKARTALTRLAEELERDAARERRKWAAKVLRKGEDAPVQHREHRPVAERQRKRDRGNWTTAKRTEKSVTLRREE